MKWLNPKALVIRLLTIWVLLFAAYIALLVIVSLLIRYWYVMAGFIVFCVGAWLALRWFRNWHDRW